LASLLCRPRQIAGLVLTMTSAFNTTRRRFIQIVGAALALVKAPVPAIATPLPRLMGDGIHNDAPAINAMLRGEMVEIGPLVDLAGAGWQGDTFTMPRAAVFRLEDAIDFGVAEDRVFDLRCATLDAWESESPVFILGHETHVMNTTVYCGPKTGAAGVFHGGRLTASLSGKYPAPAHNLDLAMQNLWARGLK
jgi:hypothetical protein